MNFLVAGFAPWGSQRRNPSGEVASALGGEALPVHWDRAHRRLLGLLRERRPAAVFLLGLAPNRRRIELEAVALNVDHHEKRPWRRLRRAIDAGPLALPSRLPLDRILRALRRAKIPSAISHHAGTFLCNHVFYVALAKTDVPAGFIHLPPTSAVPLSRQIRAVRTAIDVTLRASGSRESPP